MIQRLKSLKKFDIVFAVSTLIALMAVLVFVGCTIKRNGYLYSLTSLKQKSVHNDQMLTKQLAESGYIVDNVNYLLTENDMVEDYSLKSLDEIIEILKEYPSDYDTAIHYDGVYSVGFGFPLFGMDEWERFIANCRLHRPGYIVMVQFSANFVGTYYYIEYDGKKYHVVEDRSRDFDEGETGYSESYGKYLKIEGYPSEAGFAEYAFLTDDVNMTYKKAEEYFINDAANGASAPSFWSFYIGVYTDEIIANLIKEPDRTSETFKSDYTGFLDRHPDYIADNMRMDYDGDGILDRIYREHLEFDDGSSTNNAYLILGNGNCITLAKDMIGDATKTILTDVTADGSNDIVFIEYTNKFGNEKARLNVFENQSGNFVQVKIPENEAKSIEMTIAESDGQNIFVSKDENDELYYTRVKDGEWVTIR